MPPASGQDEITDDYVTELLKRDAKALSSSSSSLASLMNKSSRSANAPKPNTRFLRNILRDTDNHNSALLKKEAEESKLRLQKLPHSHRPAQQLYSARDRHDPKRRRLDPSDDQPHIRAPPVATHPQTTIPHTAIIETDDRQTQDTVNRPDPVITRDTVPLHHATVMHRLDHPSHSDPLDALIGPAPPSNPPVRSRGRGAQNHTSAIDSHFSSNYDPSVDVQPDPQEDDSLDWDQALEALRDRQRWKQQGADRLRAAGFTEKEVSKWEKGGEKSEEDVVWAKKGEGREWDRGKVVDEHGSVDLKPEWGRLKDS
ncbi:hypothetical protein KCU65_g644, partial [Aureobasidium melanogenum]